MKMFLVNCEACGTTFEAAKPDEQYRVKNYPAVYWLLCSRGHICWLKDLQNLPDTDTAAWRTFVSLVEKPDQPVCPFCGIRHEAIHASPYCSKAAAFNLWRKKD